MEDVIRKILNEYKSREKEIERLRKKEKFANDIVPSIVKFIKSEYGDDVIVLTRNKTTFYITHRADCPEISVFVDNENIDVQSLKRDLWDKIKNFFELDLGKYGACLELKVYKKVWTLA